jgi:hypothetical protein
MTVKDKDHKTNDRSADSGSRSEPAAQHHSNLPQGAKSDERTHMGISKIVVPHFGDIATQTARFRTSLEDKLVRLERERLRYGDAGTPEAIKKEIKVIEEQLKKPIVDPLVEKLKDPLHKMGFDVTLPSEKHEEGTITGKTDSVMAFAAVWGLLNLDHVKPTDDKFMNEVAVKLGEYTASQSLFERVLETMVDEVNASGGIATGETEAVKAASFHVLQGVDAVKWVAVVRILRDDGVLATDPYISLKAKLAIARAVGLGEEAPPSTIEIDLPDLEARTDVDIQEDNLRAVEAIYFAAMLEELKVFQVVDKLTELFQKGMLPIGKGTAGDLIYSGWRKSITRFTEIERRNLYARIFGFPGGDATQTNPNREFNDLWLRFVSAVFAFVRQSTVDQMLRPGMPPFAISQESVRKAGRDLAANLSLHGYGVAHFAATDLQSQLNEIIALLSDTDTKNAYGARDMWQVVDQVATLELGGARNSSRYRTMAKSGAIIIAWLAKHARDLSSTGHTTLLNLPDLMQATPYYSAKPMKDPSDADLVDACQSWLAVTGTPDQSVEQYAQPVESPNMTSKPIPIPDIAREMLESVGVGVNKNGKGGIAA